MNELSFNATGVFLMKKRNIGLAMIGGLVGTTVSAVKDHNIQMGIYGMLLVLNAGIILYFIFGED